MTTAAIRVNALTPPVDVPIAVLVTLSNAGTGGELTYSWTIVDQPEGPPDAIVGPATPTPTITPTKEGSYLFYLIVNQGLPDERRDMAKFNVRTFVDGRSPPAAGETVQQDPTRGWATEENRRMNDITDLRKDSGRLAGRIAVSGAVPNATLLYVSGTFEIMSGLPGAARVPIFDVANASTASKVRGSLYVLDRGVVNITAPVANEMVWVRKDGMCYGTALGGVAVGDPVYADNTGSISAAPGDYHRNVGRVAAVRGGVVDIEFDGHRQVRQIGSLVRFGCRGVAPDAGAGYQWRLPYAYGTIAQDDVTTLAPAVAHTTRLKYKVSKPGRWSRLSVWAYINAMNRTLKFEAYKNGAAMPLTASLVGVAAGEYSATDNNEAHAFEFLAGDDIEIVVTNVSAMPAYDDLWGVTAVAYEQLFD